MKLTTVEGKRGEDAAAQFLKKAGYRLVARNFSCPLGEIDIIAEEGGYVVFVEVKERADNLFGDPLEAVNKAKRRKIVRAAEWYIQKNRLFGRAFRFDVVAVTDGGCALYKNAFETN